MANSSGIYRITPAILGGVCAGIACKLDADVGVIRLLCVVFTLLSAGVVGVLYLLLWVLLPTTTCEHTGEVDVEVHDLDSDTYGRVAHTMFRRETDAAPPSYVVSAGEIAPRPPLGYTGQTPSENVISHIVSTSNDDTGYSFEQPKRSVLRSRTSVRTGFVLLIMLVTFVFGLMLHSLFVKDEPLQLWPLVFIALGIARLMLPSAHEFEAGALLVGFVLFGFGVIMLIDALGVTHLDLTGWVLDCWPLMVIGFGLGCLGYAMHSRNLIAFAGVVFALTLFVGVSAYAEHDEMMSEWVDLDSSMDDMMGEDMGEYSDLEAYGPHLVLEEVV